MSIPHWPCFLNVRGTAEQSGGVFVGEGKFDAFEKGIRHGLAVHFIELRFRIKEVHLTWSALHEEVDAALCLRRKVRRPSK